LFFIIVSPETMMARNGSLFKRIMNTFKRTKDLPMKHTVVGLLILLALVNVSRAETDSSVSCAKDSTASRLFAQAFPVEEGPPEEDVRYDVCLDISEVLLEREFVFMKQLVQSSGIPETQGLQRVLFGCDGDVTLFLGTTVQASEKMMEAFLYTKSVSVSVDDTDEQLATKASNLVAEMIVHDIADKARYKARELAKEKQEPKTGV
jgi:hypothetical protein